MAWILDQPVERVQPAGHLKVKLAGGHMSEKSIRQFTILQLILIITVAALGLIAMVQSSPFLFALFGTVTLVGFLYALLKVLFNRGVSQAYWVGFLAWGGGYLLVFYCVEGKHHSDSLMTTQLLRWTYVQLTDSILEASWSDAAAGVKSETDDLSFFPTGNTILTTGDRGPALPPLDNYLRMGQLLWGWCFAALGGWLAVGVVSKSQDKVEILPGE